MQGSVMASHREGTWCFVVAIYRSLKRHDVKLPVFGCGGLGVLRLQRDVEMFGGLQSIVDGPALRIVAQQIELPATCTSGAYVLKDTYECFLYHYEQLLAFGCWPQDGETVQMRDIVSESRELWRRTVHFCISGGAQREVCTNPANGFQGPRASFGETKTGVPVLRQFLVTSTCDPVVTEAFAAV